MTIATTDIIFRKSALVTDTVANGGRKSQTVVTSGAKHNLFPRVTKAERTAGVTRYRKEFWCNDNADDEIAYETMVWLEAPSNGGDRFAIGLGTQTDTKNDFSSAEPAWFGPGQLHTALVGGETSVELDMESSDFEFPNGGKFHISDKFKTSQTVDSDVKIGDSVEYTASSWSKITSTDDIIYPKGVYIGSDTVMTIETGVTNEEWIDLKDYEYEDEDIGTGDGATTNPALTTLVHITNGVCKQNNPDKRPVVTATCGGVTRTVNVDKDGACTGYCDAGTLNMSTGVWTTDINWTTAPDNGIDIYCTYHENCFIFSGNTVTVYLDDQVANAYLTTNTYGAGCVYEDEVTPVTTNWVETSVGTGTYDETTYPLTLFNDGTEEDNWTLTFTSAVAFTCVGASEGSVGSGTITAAFVPTNPNTGQPYFSLDQDGWAGTWASGDSITFTTSPSALPVWWREIVPAGTAAVENNLSTLGYYCE